MFVGFPYTNFHELNLDWIIKEVKEGRIQIEEAIELFNNAMAELQTVVEHVDEVSESASASADASAASATSSAESAETAEQAAQTALTATIKRRIIALGDSYGQGWTPDGTVESWIAKLKTMLNIGNNDFFSIAEGGSGFWVGDNTDVRYLPNMLQRAYDITTDPETITDIVLGFGYNDINASNDSALRSNATALMTKIRTLFPQNPRIWLFGIGYTTNHANQFQLMTKVYKAYQTFVGYGFTKLTPFVCQKAFFSSDGIHINANGQEKVAQMMSQVINNGYVKCNDFQLYSQDVTALFKLIAGGNMNGPVYVYRQGEHLFITAPTNSYLRGTYAGDNRLTLSKAPVKIGKYENTMLTGFHNWSVSGQMAPCSIVYRSNDLSGYHWIPGFINIAPENDNDNTLYIWLSIFATTDDFTNYLSISNVFEVQVSGFTMDFELIS